MSWWQDFWKKPSSASGHFAWGFLVASVASRLEWQALFCVLAAWIVGTLWEVVPELSLQVAWRMKRIGKPVVRQWHARAADVTPWILGGLAQVFIWWGKT